MNTQTLALVFLALACEGKAARPVAKGAPADPVWTRAVITQCREARVQLRQAHDPTEAARLGMLGCSHLFREPACSKAWVGLADSVNGTSWRDVFETCKQAYCPKLSAFTRPDACLKTQPRDTQAWQEFATKLWAAALVRDHGAELAPEAATALSDVLSDLSGSKVTGPQPKP